MPRGKRLELTLVVRTPPTPAVLADVMAAATRQVWARQAQEQAPTPPPPDADPAPTQETR